MDIETTKKLVNKYIQRTIDKSIVGMLMEPRIDRNIILEVGSALKTLEDTYHIEDFTLPEVSQDIENPTMITIEFDYVPGREFDWTKTSEIVKLQFKISPQGILNEEMENV